jgi:tRNA (guanine-N7-)-methyltransferase
MARVRHHVNPLRAEFLARSLTPLPLPASGEVETELGCADARFLFERAPSRPATRFYGLEIRGALVEQVNRTARELSLDNLSAHACNINVDLDRLFPDRRLARVFVNFPDPWFKRRHHKRRLMAPELVEVLHRKLRPRGELFFQSDVFDLALDALGVLEAADALFCNHMGPWGFLRSNPYGAKSLREVRCEERGARVWRLLYHAVP